MDGVNLWSNRDDVAVQSCRSALNDGNLVLALLAVERATDETARHVLNTVRDWSSNVRAMTSECGVDGYTALKSILADKAGLSGTSENYYQPQNCHISSVLRRGTGMPIVLSGVWIAVGKLSGLHVEGIGLPGHFIVRVGDRRSVLVDPFASGRIITFDTCVRMVRQLRKISWDDRFMDTVSHNQLIARLCRNLLVCYQRKEQGRAMYRTARFASLVYPDDVEHQLTYARVSHSLQLTPIAITAYRHVVDRFPGTAEAASAKEPLNELIRERPLLH